MSIEHTSQLANGVWQMGKFNQASNLQGKLVGMKDQDIWVKRNEVQCLHHNIWVCLEGEKRAEQNTLEIHHCWWGSQA